MIVVAHRDSIRAREAWEAENEESHQTRQRPKRRQKRSVSKERNVEVLVVSDKKMMDFYSNEDLNNYILTVMNMVLSSTIKDFFI